MSKPRHIVRTIKSPRREMFEDWTWPIHVALITFGAYVVGIVGARLRFDDDRILNNAMTWTIVTIVSVGLLMIVAQWVNRHWLRRGLMLSLVLSLILNLSVLVTLSWMHLFAPSIATEDVIAELVEPEEPEKHPEFFPLAIDGDDRPALDFEKPVSTGQPDLEQSDLVQKTTAKLDADRTQVEVASSPSATVPQPIDRAEIVRSAPRQSDQQGTLSRQRQLAQPRLARPMVDNLASPRTVESQQLTASPSEIQRQTSQAAREHLDASDSPTSAEVVPETRLSRRNNSTAAPDVADASRPTTRASDRDPARPSHATIVAGQRPTVSRQTEPDAPTPANVVSKRQQTTSPDRNPEVDLLVPDGIVRRTRIEPRREQPLQDAEQMAEAPLSVPERRQPETVAPSAADSLASQVADSDETVASPDAAQPADSSVARQSPRLPKSWMNDGPAVETVARSSQSEARVPDRATASESPVSTSDSTADVSLPRRALTPSIVAASPQANQADGTLRSEQPTREPAASPARTAITKSSRGVAGQGQAPNMDRGETAPQSPVTVASSSARRDTPTQQNRTGPSIAPTAGARIPRSIAGAPVPTTNLRAQSLATAEDFDAVTLAAKQATAAATRLPRQAKAPVSRETAPIGQADLDVGAVRVATNVGQRQPGGGGQPQVVQGELEAQQSRPRVGGTPAPALPQPQTAKIVATPPHRAQPSSQRAIAAASPTARQSTGVAPSAGPQVSPSDEPSAVAETVRPGPTVGRSRSRASEVVMSEVASPGGGTSESLRTPFAKPIPVGTKAENVRVASQERSGGVPEAVPLQSQGQRSRRSTAGVYGPVANEPIGAIADRVAQDGTPTAVSEAAVQRQSDASHDVPGPVLSDLAQDGADARPDRTTRQPKGLKADTDVDVPVAGSLAENDSQTPPLDTALASQAGEIARNRSGGLLVPVDTLDAVGGLSSDVASNVGIASRKAQPDSQLVADSRARFIRRNVGGSLSIDTRVAIPTEAFQTRANRRGEEPAGGNGRPSQRTEEAIELGLVYLASQQLRDGSWSLSQADAGTDQAETATIRSDTAATGLALLAFLGAGYHHHSDEYGTVVHQGLNFLIERQKPDGDLYLAEDENSNRSAWLYSHGIAAIALCEAYGMTQDPQLRAPAQRAIDFIVAAQHPSRGGWRYAPGVGSDTSVSGWMVMALRSGELANLEVPPSAWQLVESWLDIAQLSDNRRELYRYNPFAPNNLVQGHGRRPTRTMTAVGLLMRMYTGWRRNNRDMVLGAEYLRANLPEIGSVREPQRDTYYWYYATQVMFHMRGEYWESWNRRLHPLLTSSQVQSGPLAGSWDSQQPIPDRWADHGGRLYVTTLNLLSLEVYYRHLPIYEDTAR